MLLVDDRKPEIGEDDAFLKERVSADRDVDLASRQRRQRIAPLRRPVAAGHQRDAQTRLFGERRHSLEMLTGEHFGRRHHRRLPSRLDHLGHREQRDDGLARADVALQKPDHALLGSKIGADVLDRLALRRRSAKTAARPRCGVRAPPRRHARGRRSSAFVRAREAARADWRAVRHRRAGSRRVRPDRRPRALVGRCIDGRAPRQNPAASAAPASRRRSIRAGRGKRFSARSAARATVR